MAFIKQIQPIKLLDKTATKLSSYVINYDGISCDLYWWLSDSTDNKIIDGNYSLPQEIINGWGLDDTVISESIATSKGFVLI